jgi:hypothetical protein
VKEDSQDQLPHGQNKAAYTHFPCSPTHSSSLRLKNPCTLKISCLPLPFDVNG